MMSGEAATTSLLGRITAARGMFFPLASLAMLVVLLVPLPRGVLDLLLVLNLTLSIIILVTTIYVRSPLEFAVFPSVLLFVTLFRLVLNVATTRLILTADRFGDPVAAKHAAGEVVLAFSNFVAADKLTVGVIIFLIIFIIQFVVITRGSTRISEVAARFALDAMPGKQMAIDADIAAGILKDQEARARRDAIEHEADFYGAMDGASRFVRGDAIAAVLITIVNVAGGLYVGWQKGWAVMDSADLFTRLTIGDGLVTQVPAFIVSLAAGLIVTRNSARSDLGEQVIGQMLSRPAALLMAALFLAMLSLTGLPSIPLLTMAGGCALMAYVLRQQEAAVKGEPAEASVRTATPVEKLLEIDVLEVELGGGLERLADPERGGNLLERIEHLRRRLARELGFILPAVRVYAGEDLDADDYVLHVRGHARARGVAYPEQYLAVAVRAGQEMPDAGPGVDPIADRPAWWITESQLEEAGRLGLEAIEATDLLVSHLEEVARAHAHELLTRQEVCNLLDNLKQRAPALVQEVVPGLVKPGELHRVLQNLLRERVSIRDLEIILETLADHAEDKDLEKLTEHVRQALGRTICRQYADGQNHLVCVTLAPNLEELIRRGTGSVPGLSAGAIEHLTEQLRERCSGGEAGQKPVLLCSGSIRPAVRRMLETKLPRLPVLAVTEIAPEMAVDSIGCIDGTRSEDEAVPAVAAGAADV